MSKKAHTALFTVISFFVSLVMILLAFIVVFFALAVIMSIFSGNGVFKEYYDILNTNRWNEIIGCIVFAVAGASIGRLGAFLPLTICYNDDLAQKISFMIVGIGLFSFGIITAIAMIIFGYPIHSSFVFITCGIMFFLLRNA